MRNLLLLLSAGLLLAPVIATGASPPRIGGLDSADTDSKLGDCAEYLYRGNGDLIFFNDYDGYAYMKIDGQVVHLFQQLPPDDRPAEMTIYSDVDGHIQVGDTSQPTGQVIEDRPGVAGTLTVIAGGAAQVIRVTGFGEC